MGLGKVILVSMWFLFFELLAKQKSKMHAKMNIFILSLRPKKAKNAFENEYIHFLHLKMEFSQEQHGKILQILC